MAGVKERKTTEMFEIKNLNVKIADDDTKIPKGLNLKVHKGEVHAITGPNGPGRWSPEREIGCEGH